MKFSPTPRHEKKTNDDKPARKFSPTLRSEFNECYKLVKEENIFAKKKKSSKREIADL